MSKLTQTLGIDKANRDMNRAKKQMAKAQKEAKKAQAEAAAAMEEARNAMEEAMDSIPEPPPLPDLPPPPTHESIADFGLNIPPPPKLPSFEQKDVRSPTYQKSITRQNIKRLGETIPVVYGRSRFYPDDVDAPTTGRMIEVSINEDQVEDRVFVIQTDESPSTDILLVEFQLAGVDSQITRSRLLPSTMASASALLFNEGRLFVAGVKSSNDKGAIWELDPDGDDGEGTEIRELPDTIQIILAMAIVSNRRLLL